MSTIAERLSAVDTKLNNILTNANTQLTNKGKSTVSDISNIPTAMSELKNPTGTVNITQNGTIDVSNYASANVNVPTPSPNLQSKSVEITENGTTTITPDSGYDGLNQVEVTTNVSGSGGKNNQSNMGFFVTARVSYVKSGLKLKVAKTGIYTVKWIAKRDSSSNTWGTGLYIDNVLYGSKNEVWGATYTFNNVAQTTSIATFQKNEVEHVNLTEGQVVEIYGRSGSNGNWLYLHALSIEEE